MNFAKTSLILIGATAALAGCKNPNGGPDTGGQVQPPPPPSHTQFHRGNPNQLTWVITQVPVQNPHLSGDNFEIGDAFRLQLMGPNIKMIPIGAFRERRAGKYHGGNPNFGPYDGKKLTTNGVEILCFENFDFEHGPGPGATAHYIAMMVDSSDPNSPTLILGKNHMDPDPAKNCQVDQDGTGRINFPTHPGAYHANY